MDWDAAFMVASVSCGLLCHSREILQASLYRPDDKNYCQQSASQLSAGADHSPGGVKMV